PACCRTSTRTPPAPASRRTSQPVRPHATTSSPVAGCAHQGRKTPWWGPGRVECPWAGGAAAGEGGQGGRRRGTRTGMGTGMGQVTGWDALLSDGGLVHIRPVAPTDGGALHALHEAASDRSIYLRYFSVSRRAGDRYVDTLLSGGPHSGLGLVAEQSGAAV